MAYAEKYGTKGKYRARYLKPDGSYGSEPGFTTAKKAREWGTLEEAKIRRQPGDWVDPKATKEKLGDWVERWWESIHLAETTTANYGTKLRSHILPAFGNWEVGKISPLEVSKWEIRMRKIGYAHSTVMGARALLHTIFEDAIAEGLVGGNPVKSQRKRGQDYEAAEGTAESLWATPLQVLLIAERCAVMSGRDEDAVLVLQMAYCGMRWAESIGMEKPDCQVRLHRRIRVHWHIPEVSGKCFRRQTKTRAGRRDIDVPPFLAGLLEQQSAATKANFCGCTHQEHPNEYVYLGPKRGHHRRSNFGERIFRPAADGETPARSGRSQAGMRPAMPVLVDAGRYPGTRVQQLPYAVAGEPWIMPTGRGQLRRSQLDERGRHVALDDMPLASWLPIVEGLTPHDLRHSHRVWLDQARIPDVARDERMGHVPKGMDGIYGHVSEQMRTEIKDLLEGLFQESLAERFKISPRSSVALIDELLSPLREKPREMISTISPLMQKTPA